MQEIMPRVGVRELRQSLSVYLERVAAGETFEVTEHGHAVAVLAPVPEPVSIPDRLVACGRATRPIGDLLDLKLALGDEPSNRLSAALEEERAERL